MMPGPSADSGAGLGGALERVPDGGLPVPHGYTKLAYHYYQNNTFIE
jgi:hypothetical protein